MTPSRDVDQKRSQDLVKKSALMLMVPQVSLVGVLNPLADPEYVAIWVAHVHLANTPRLVGRGVGDLETLL